MYTNEYLRTNTNQDVLKDTAYMFPETYQTVNEYGKTGVTFQNVTTTTNVAQPQTIITYQTENLQPINQDIHESLEPAFDPLTFIDKNTVFTGTQGNAETTFETATQEINPPQTTVQTTYEYIQPQTTQNLNQIITYTETPANEFVQYDTALQTQPINETITINKTTQAPIIETKVLPSQFIQSPPTIETTTYQYSEPVVENVTVQNIEQTQNVDLGGQYTQFVEEVKQVPDPSSYSLVPQPIIAPPPKPKETIIVKVPKIQKVIVPKIQKVIVPSNKKIIVTRPPGAGVPTIQTIPQPVPAAVPPTISTSTVRVPYSTASVQAPVVTQVPVPMASTVRVPPPVPVPATIPYSTGSVRAVTTTMPYSATSVRVPYSVASVKVPVTTPVPVATPTPLPVTAVQTPVPAAVGITPTLTTTIRPTLAVPARPPVVPVPRPLPVATPVPVRPVVTQPLPYGTLSQRPLVANAAQPLPVAAVPPRPLVVPQAANLGMARPAVYNASTYNASTIRPVGRTIPMTTGVVPAPVNNNMMGNMAFPGKYTTRTYNARKL